MKDLLGTKLINRGIGLFVGALFVFGLAFTNVSAQGSTAKLSGTVVDQSGASIPGAEVLIENPATGLKRTSISNNSGIFYFPALPPAVYVVTAQKDGFAPVEFKDITLNVGDEKSLKIQLKVGQVGAEVEVIPDPVLADESGAVSTVVSREVVDNLPLNGRDIRPLLQLSPGVALTGVSEVSPGGFSVNGQRPQSNYVIVDGVSANTGVAVGVDTGARARLNNGTSAGTNVQGSYSNLASVDAIQEFQILTSTFAPEFGRSPGGQVILNTRSGTNKYHGSLYEYFRNDVLDAADFFINAAGLEKPALRYNNFGGTFSGPLPFLNFGEGVPFFHDGKDRTHVFVSYEGQRFLLPQAPFNFNVVSNEFRSSQTNPLARTFFNQFPVPTGPTVPGTIYAPFQLSYSEPNSADSVSVRIDHKYKDKYTFFGRYVWAPSSANIRDSGVSSFRTFEKNANFITLGATQIFSSNAVNDLRFNWTKNEGNTRSVYDGFGGGDRFASELFAPGDTQHQINFFSPQIPNSRVFFFEGDEAANRQRQINIVDNFTYNLGAHQLKFGVDFRRLSPKTGDEGVRRQLSIFSINEIQNSMAAFYIARYRLPVTLIYDNFSAFFQDTWKLSSRTTMTYGFRWEVNPSPKAEGLPVVTFNQAPVLTQRDQSNIDLALRDRYYDTSYTNFAPRFGISHLLHDKQGWETSLRGGVGIFYDIGQTGFGFQQFPYGGTAFNTSVSLPLDHFTIPEPNLNLSPTNRQSLEGFSDDFKLPRTYQWNITATQSLGKKQALTVGYVGALGRDLTRGVTVRFVPIPSTTAFFNPNVFGVSVVGNGGESDYHSLQTQFERRLSNGFSAIVNYTLSKSEDNASNSNVIAVPTNQTVEANDKGLSDFDVKHNFTTAITYNIPTPKWNGLAKAILGGWSLNSYAFVRSGLPLSVKIRNFKFDPDTNQFLFEELRPNVTGEPFYIFDSSLAGGRRLNVNAFDFEGVPSGQHGNFERNSIRWLGAWQVDLGLHRNFKFGENLNVQLRLESFNVFNHPNFSNPNTEVNRTPFGSVIVPFDFGLSTRMLSNTSASGFSVGGNPLFQFGGPRSHQIAVRITF